MEIALLFLRIQFQMWHVKGVRIEMSHTLNLAGVKCNIVVTLVRGRVHKYKLIKININSSEFIDRKDLSLCPLNRGPFRGL